MYKKLFFPVLFLSFSLNAFCQQSGNKPFILEGKINLDSGELKLSVVGDTSYYPPELRNITVPIYGGIFQIKGQLPNPVAFTVDNHAKAYFSRMIVVQEGTQSVTNNINATGEMPSIDNEEMKGYTDFRNAFAKVHQEETNDSLLEARLLEKHPHGLPDSIRIRLRENTDRHWIQRYEDLLAFVKTHPSSYISFWHLVSLNMFGYERIFDEIFSNFSPEVQHSYSGKVLAANLKKAGLLGTGVKFPKMSLVDLNQDKSGTFLSAKSKYTLINFWNSEGTQSTRDFAALTEVYNKYKAQGFQIINIASDNVDDKERLDEAIKNTGIKWPQYWDQNGIGAKALLVSLFPMSYLLDSDGTILKRNVRSQELADFLKKNMH